MAIDGIPVTNLARTLVDLAAVLTAGALERSLDDPLRRRLVTDGAVRNAIEHVDGLGTRGARAMAALLDGRDPLDGPSASDFQKGLRRLVLGAGFPFVEEYRLPGLPYRVDLGGDGYLTVVEADSKKHHAGSQISNTTCAARDEITAEGYPMLHITAKNLKERPGWILATIERTLGTRGWPGPPTVSRPAVTLRTRH